MAKNKTQVHSAGKSFCTIELQIKVFDKVQLYNILTDLSARQIHPACDRLNVIGLVDIIAETMSLWRKNVRLS